MGESYLTQFDEFVFEQEDQNMIINSMNSRPARNGPEWSQKTLCVERVMLGRLHLYGNGCGALLARDRPCGVLVKVCVCSSISSPRRLF